MGPVVALADENTDAEWARRAPNVTPADLARLARTKVKPTVEDARARREARSLRMWWQHDTAMLHLHGALADVDGARFEATINRSNLAAVCRTGGHHRLLIPTGNWALVGNPNQPDGLQLVPVDQLTAEHAEQLGLPPPTAPGRV